MKKISLFYSVILLSAFLLFQIELIIAKIILPKFGGSYLVWGACIVFFQGILLLGYLYSHLVVQKFGVWRYRKFHLVLILFPMLFFPVRNITVIAPNYNIPLTIDVAWKLLYSVGPVFFVLSTTSIIFQSWLGDSELAESKNPYILYSLSNLGSFAALLSYPFLFEPTLDLDKQIFIWRMGYLFLLLLHFAVFRAVKADKSAVNQAAPVFFNIQLNQEVLSWVLLGAVSSVMFLSVTNVITFEVAPIPLLWIMPLCIYILSFTLNFQEKPWCPSWIRDKFYISVGLSLLLFFFVEKHILPFIINLGLFLFSLFIVCMFCQNELYLIRPKDTRRLTLFYFLISLGSFIGVIAVNWIIPLVSTFMIEYLLGLFLMSLVLAVAAKKTKFYASEARLVIYPLVILILWALVFKKYNVFGVAFIIWVFIKIFSQFKLKPYAFAISMLCILLTAPFIDRLWSDKQCIYTKRNYYGIFKVSVEDKVAVLYHGTTLHGMQYLVKEKQNEPLAYYHRFTPIGELMNSGKFNLQQVGIVGLGCGTLSAYGKPGEEIDFFEIDNDAYLIATGKFTYLKNSGAKLKFIFGDARISMASVKDKKYDLLVIDAFSGDSIPAHLLTTDAILEYRKHLNNSGIIMFNVSNRYLDLAPVMFSNAFSVNALSCFKENNVFPEKFALFSQWVAFTWDEQVFQKLIFQFNWNKSYVHAKLRRPWTDKYSNISSVLKLKDIVSGLKYFTPFYW